MNREELQREALEARGWEPTYWPYWQEDEGKTSSVLVWECQAEGFTQQIGEKTAARLADSYLTENVFCNERDCTMTPTDAEIEMTAEALQRWWRNPTGPSAHHAIPFALDALIELPTLREAIRNVLYMCLYVDPELPSRIERRLRKTGLKPRGE